MGKMKATLTDPATVEAANRTPIADTSDAALTPREPAVVVFGKDEAGKPHASWFAAADAAMAERAAGLMGMRVLPVTTDKARAAALEAASGRIFASGKAFSPFCKMPLYEALSAFEGSFAPPPPVEREPEPVITVRTVPTTWADIAVGSAVLASSGPDEGWWPSVVVEDRGEGLFVVRWQDYDDEPSFVRRADDLALMPRSAASLIA